MNLEELNAALGAYFRLHQAQIEAFLTQGFYTRQFLTIISGVKDQYVANNKHLASILQPYIRGFTPKTDKLAFGTEITQVKRAKIDYEITSDDIVDMEKSALGILLQGVGSNTTNLPSGIANMVFNSILDKSEEEMEMDLVWNGAFDEATYPTPGDAEDINDGFDKKLDSSIDSGRLTPFALGAYSDAEVLDYTEEFVKNLPTPVKRKSMPIFMSVRNEELYWENRRTKFGTHTDHSDDSVLTVHKYKNIKPVGLPSMGDSKRMFTTVPGNMIMCEDGTGEERRLTVTLKPDERCIRITGDFKVGFGFRAVGKISSSLNDQVVFCNDTK
ncbi:hypothetical protein [Chondrinema litorale]|uniref:hypothetical protein n=1 Tax=Chondrinema litorale TaxID=2994555 RepID=UPI002542A169|nr:hypothetical protein [Chondrinema litorale]UZR93156.1 hypothetical protein OQ292_14950 [Chondrinema litorale]